MSTDKIEVVRINSPSLEFTLRAQDIGFSAWRYGLDERSESEIKNVFNSDDLVTAEKLKDRIETKIGRFVGTTCYFNGDPVGYAWGTEDVGNMGKVQQHVKRAVGKIINRPPYIWLAQINVMHEFQNIGLGKMLLRETLKPFEDNLKVATYVFDENREALRWFANLGFYPRPKTPKNPNADDPDGPDIYFGENAKHVLQWRLENASKLSLMRILGQKKNLDYKLTES